MGNFLKQMTNGTAEIVSRGERRTGQDNIENSSVLAMEEGAALLITKMIFAKKENANHVGVRID